MASAHLVPQTYNVGSTIKITCMDDISQDTSTPNATISKIFAVFDHMPFTNSCTVKLLSHGRPLVLKAMDPRYSLKFRRSLGLPDTFNHDAFYELLQNPDIAKFAKTIASNLETIKGTMLLRHCGSRNLYYIAVHQGLSHDTTTPDAGLLEFLSLFTTTKDPTSQPSSGLPQSYKAIFSPGSNVGTVLKHPGLSELAACLIMESDFIRQSAAWATLTNGAAKGVPTLVTTCLVYTMSKDGDSVYACGGLITLEVPGSTGDNLEAALAEIAETPENIEYCIHEFESLLLTLSYFNLSLRGLRTDNLILTKTSSESPRLVLIDAGSVKDISQKKIWNLYRNREEENGIQMVSDMLGLNYSDLYNTHGIAKWDVIEMALMSHNAIEWHIIMADIKHFSSRDEAVAMAPYTALILRIARVIFLHNVFDEAADVRWPLPALQRFQRVLSFHDDQGASPPAMDEIARRLKVVKSGSSHALPSTSKVEAHVSNHRVLDHEVWRREAEVLIQSKSSIGETSFEEWVTRKFEALRIVTGIHLHRRDLVAHPQATWAPPNTPE